MKKKNGLIKTSLACALIFGGVGLLAGCGKDDPGATISDIYVTGDYANVVKEFTVGSEVSLSGAIVEVSFSDGTTQTITVTDEMWDKSNYDFTTIGEKEITVKFKVNGEEKSESITIKIVNPVSVQEVIDAINNLQNSSPLDRWMESIIDEIKDNYNALSDVNKGFVNNYSDFFASYKSVKSDVISNYVVLDDYEESDRATVSGYIENAVDAISNAVNIGEIDSAVTTAKANIDSIETTLEIRKAIVLDNFDRYVENNFDEEDYSPLKWNILQSIIQTVRGEIENTDNIVFLPTINDDYVNSNFMEIDNLTTENLKNDIANLPDINTVTDYDADLMLEVKTILNAYENVLTSDEKNRVESLMSQVESLEDRLGTLDLNDYKETIIESINLFKQKQSEYDANEWQDILDEIDFVVSQIENRSYDDGAKLFVDEQYESLMDSLYGYATSEVNDLYALLTKIPNRAHVSSNNVIFSIFGAYNIFNNKFAINFQKYEIFGSTVVDEEDNTYEIVNGQVEINGVMYTIVSDIKASINELETGYNNLDENEKSNYKSIQVSQTISNFKNDVYQRMDYFGLKLKNLREYNDSSIYNSDKIGEIIAIIDDFRYLSLNEYQLESYKASVDQYYESALNAIAMVNNKLDDIKETINEELSDGYDYVSYYTNDWDKIVAIIEKACDDADKVELIEGEMSDAVAEVQSIIDSAKVEIAKVKTYREVNTDKVNGEILPQLEAYIKSLIAQEGFEDVPTNDEISDPNCEKQLAVAYQKIKDHMLSDSVIGLKDDEFTELLNNYERQKIVNLDYIGRVYSKSIDATEIRSKLRHYIENPLESDMYINLGPVRTSIKGGWNYSTDYNASIKNIPDNNINLVVVNGAEYNYGKHYKIVNGNLYVSLTSLSFSEEDEIDVQIYFTANSVLTDSSGDVVYDSYKIILNNQVAENGEFSSISPVNTSIGKESEDDTNVGYFEGETNKLATYKNGADLELVYKSNGNNVSGPVVVKYNFVQGLGMIDNIYYIYDLDNENTMTLPIRNDDNPDRYVTEIYSHGGEVTLSVSSEAGIDFDTVVFNFETKINVARLKEQYKTDMEAYVKREDYDEDEWNNILNIINDYKVRFDKADEIYDDMMAPAKFANIWYDEYSAVVGIVDEEVATARWNHYTIDGNKVYWFGAEVGHIEENRIIINEITLSFGETEMDGWYKIFVNSGENKYETEYIATISNTSFYIYSEDFSRVYEYVVSENDILDGIYDVGTANFSYEGESAVATVESTVAFLPVTYSIENSSVIDDSRLGFKNIIDRDYSSEVEFVLPNVTINNNELIEKEDHNKYKYYEYKLSKGETQLVLNSTDFDSVNFYAKVRDDNSYEMVNMSFPYTIQDASDMYSIEIFYYRASDDCEAGYQIIYIVDYVPITSVKVNNVDVGNSRDGYYIDMDRMGTTNTLQIIAEEGYEYFIRDYDGNTVNLDNLYLEIGYNSYSIMIQNKENKNEVYSVNVTINVADDLNDIKIGNVSDNNGEYDVYGMEPATELIVAYTGEANDIDSIDVVDASGNSILNNSGKIDMTDIPILRAKLKVTISDVIYYKDIVLLNVDKGQGSEYESDNENGQEFIGLDSSIKFTYKVDDDSNITIPYDSDYDSRMWIWDSNGDNVDVRLGTLVVPKGFNINNIFVEKGSVYTGDATIELEKVTSVSNMLKLVIKKDGYVNGVVYFLLEEDEYAIDNNCDIYAGDIGLREYYELRGNVSSPEEVINVIKGQSVAVSEDTTITSESDHYLEGVSKYYRANLTVDVGDFFFVLCKNKFQEISVSSNGILEYDDYEKAYTFTNLFETGDVIIVDVLSADKTTKCRYIYALTKADAMLSIKVNIDYYTEINLELRNGGAAGDFMDVGEERPMMIAFVGTQNLNDSVSVKFSASQEALATGAITLTPQYDENNVIDISNPQELSVIDIALQEGTVPGIMFYSHTIINGESVMIIPFIIIFAEMPE